MYSSVVPGLKKSFYGVVFTHKIKKFVQHERHASILCKKSSRWVNTKRYVKQFKERKPVIPTSIHAAIDNLKNSYMKESAGVQRLLKAYYDKLVRNEQFLCSDREQKYPLIAIEGLNGAGKTTVAHKVAKLIRGIYMSTPAKSTLAVRHYFEDTELPIRVAYYFVGDYIAAMDALCALEKGPVIMDRFWHSTNAYHLAMAAQGDVFFPMPAPGDRVFCWPLDLMMPDLCLFLSVTEDNRTKRHCNRKPTYMEHLLESNERFRNNVLTAFERMHTPRLIKVDANKGIDDVVADVEIRVKRVLESYMRSSRD